MNHKGLTEEPVAGYISNYFDKIQTFWHPD